MSPAMRATKLPAVDAGMHLQTRVNINIRETEPAHCVGASHFLSLRLQKAGDLTTFNL